MKILKILKIIVIGVCSFLLLFFPPMAGLLLSIHQFWVDGIWFYSVINSLWLVALVAIFSALLIDLYHDKINK